MSIALKLSNELVEMAKPYAAAGHRTVLQQIEYWARLGKAVDDNPGLPLQFIKDALLAAQEAKAGLLTQYESGGLIVLAVLATATFTKVIKKSHAKDKIAVDSALKEIAKNPAIGFVDPRIGAGVTPKLSTRAD